MNLSNLNEAQRKAVTHTEGPLLVLAGAGSGKTRVLTHRIAYLIEEKGAFPSDILAITFTNKASEEMKARVNNLIGGKAVGMWMGTFHSVCLRFLRKDADQIGYKKDFVIYDVSDQNTLVKNCMKKLNVDTKEHSPKKVRNIISSLKNEMKTPQQYEEESKDDFWKQKYVKIFKEYQREIKANNAMDFDDLINNAIKLLRENKNILDYYRHKFKYILIDEYQDTNHSQYLLASLLAGSNGNICAVGDNDQSIYKFRGADIRNIIEFEKDFQNAKVIKLERNYRSTDVILDAANSVIENNQSRKAKNLWTDKTSDEKVKYFRAYTEKDEANYVVNQIMDLYDGNYSDFAILYRTNAQSRHFEEILMKNNIPYQVVGGLKFYDRKEIKDVLAYLKLIQNPLDNISLERIINEPKRGIGKRTIEKLRTYTDELGICMYDGILEAKNSGMFSSRALGALNKFKAIIEKVRQQMDDLTIAQIYDMILDESGYLAYLEKQDTVTAQSRIENIQELGGVILDFEKENDDQSLENFLATITLESSVDTMDDEEPGVLMMTVHSSKGLEFKNVFLVGMEENVFPSYMSREKDEDIEEERRLCYVGITRAQERLFITHADSRTLYGRTNRNKVSRFVEEIDQKLLEDERKNSYSFKNSFGGYNNQKNQGIDETTYKAGVKVKHKSFGKGTVIDKSGDILTIAFDNQGIKKLMAGVAPLEIV